MQALFLRLLKSELVPALGCTEPIAVAFAAARAREILGSFPDSMEVICSGNVIKNVKGVIVPATGNLRGIDTAAILGAVAGRAERKLEVLSEVKPEDVTRTKELMQTGLCRLSLAEGVENLYIKIIVTREDFYASVTLSGDHTNIIEEVRNGSVLKCRDTVGSEENAGVFIADRSFLTLKSIYNFVQVADTEQLKIILQPQVDMNSRIAREGLDNPWGAEVGRTILETGSTLETKMKAWTAAGSDARMAGSILPVVINSGSGNQGMTASMPVIIWAQHLKVGEVMFYRALALSNLVAIYIKSGIGKLSAYCGAVSAAAGSAAAIAFLEGKDQSQISDTVINTLANSSGILCDGAKASCAAKIAVALDAAFLGYRMAERNRRFSAGEGLVVEDPDNTIANICRVAREGMKSTDLEILTIMTE